MDTLELVSRLQRSRVSERIERPGEDRKAINASRSGRPSPRAVTISSGHTGEILAALMAKSAVQEAARCESGVAQHLAIHAEAGAASEQPILWISFDLRW